MLQASTSSNGRTFADRLIREPYDGLISRTIYTLGHSTRSLQEFTDLLCKARIELLVDVRSIPHSRRHPQFEGSALAGSLSKRDIAYLHEPQLGGFRKPLPRSPNMGWQHASFRGYADHMTSAGFQLALARLEMHAREQATCLMCAEAHWRNCHRRLISDALVVRGWRVLHLGVRGFHAKPAQHEVAPFAVIIGGSTLTYPPPREPARREVLAAERG
jgi:uncharacterized protein (DUF488 family)